MRIKTCLLLFAFMCATIDANQVVNLYTYPAYFPPEVLQQFEKATHIHVNVSTIDGDNDTVFAKLQLNSQPSYDLVIISSYSLAKFERTHLIQPLKKTLLPQSNHLKQRLLHDINPPKQWFALPFVWGTTGIVVNRRFIHPQQAHSWLDLWRPTFRNQLLLIDSVRDIFAMSLLSLHLSPNATNVGHINQAYQHLLKLKNNIRLFNSESIINLLVDEDIQIGVSYSGEAYLAQQQNPNLVYIYPTDGFPIWVDTLAMVNHAPHPQAAYQLLNFLCRPDIAKQIIQSEGVIVANDDAMKQLPSKLQRNPILNPSPTVLKRGILTRNIGRAKALMLERWQQLKLAIAG